MKQSMLCLVVLCLVSSLSFAGVINIAVTPQGDGCNGKDRYGYGFPWEWVGYNSGGNSNWVGHWYDSPYGSYRDVYLQVGLGGLTSADDVVSATLNINILDISGSNSIGLYHKDNSAAATGNASDQISGDTLVGSIATSTHTGWLSIDVTNCIKNNLNNGNSWAAFNFVNAGYSGITFASGDSADAPYLQIATSVPEPATMFLLGIGSLSLIRRRK